ncbi:agmatinase family protein [Evansella sp. LMS18]|jgi:formiminoglutamase|uniref:agmatinase family protein n=1 Tax=Evansella sp. LMS18 TaxID=2924033 RepID=UPI0020D1E375|nr:agmatinase family protein [Evansella sp. LMS18]UTR08945.1 agmatinase family protein [Evansella sp. LMS18]
MKISHEGLTPPSFTWTSDRENAAKVHEWIKPVTEIKSESELNEADALLFGIPLSRSSISASAASEFPDFFRRSWKGFATYNIDADMDLSHLSVIDLGDTIQHVTNIEECHRNIIRAMRDIKTRHSHPLPIAIGGDHSVTAKLIEGFKAAEPDKTIGLLQFDTHFDLRDPSELGPANGTPVRLMIEKGLIKGNHVHNIGLHGFFNTKDLKEFADTHNVNYTTMSAVRKKGIERVVNAALEELSEEVDVIYLTCDMDVLDMAYAPGVPAATPGGMRTDELFEAVFTAGQHPKVSAMDIVCLDPHKDFGQMTVKAGTHVFLSFLSGYALRNKQI